MHDACYIAGMTGWSTTACDSYLEVNILASWYILEMYFQNLLPALDIRIGYRDVAIKTTRPDKCFV